jgi:hypothetical protein
MQACKVPQMQMHALKSVVQSQAMHDNVLLSKASMNDNA